MSIYCHDPLPPGRVIRVLHLSPATSLYHPLHCRLSLALLDGEANKAEDSDDNIEADDRDGREEGVNQPQAVGYEALSYVWGTRTRRSILYVGDEGKVLHITPNCESCLRYLRLPDRERCLWVDAICIDQTSIPEKNVQVALMGDLYRNAKMTWISLGNEADDEKYLGIVLSGMKKWKSFNVALRWWMKFKDMDAAKEFTEPFNHVIQSKWWSRVWTFQEFILSPHRKFFSRYTSATWSDLQKAYMVFAEADRGIDLSSVSVRSFLQAIIFAQVNFKDYSAGMDVLQNQDDQSEQVRQVEHDTERVALEVLDAVRNRDCYDPRDKIYGIYQILKDLHVELPIGDYSRPISTLYEEVTLCWIKRFGKVRILEQVTSNVRQPGLPSWVPDFSQLQRTSEIARPWTTYDLTDFRDTAEEVQTSPHEINLRGKVLGHVKTVISQMPVFPQEKAAWEEDVLTIAHLSQWAHFVQAMGIADIVRPLYYLSVLMAETSLHRRPAGKPSIYARKAANDKRIRIEDLLKVLANHLTLDPANPDMNRYDLIVKKLRQKFSKEQLIQVGHDLNEAAGRRTLLLTDQRTIALCLGAAREDDLMVWFLGAEVLMIVRPEGMKYSLVGAMFTHKHVAKTLPPEDELEQFTLI